MEPKLNWQALVNLYLWHRYPKESLVTDDTAYVSALHVRDFVNAVISAVTDTDPESER